MHSPTTPKKGTANTASSSGRGTNPSDNINAAAKDGRGLDRARSKAAMASIASAYQGNSGTPARRNCGSGSASHQSNATHSHSPTRLKVIRTKVEGAKFGIALLKVHNRSSNVKDRRGFAGAGSGTGFWNSNSSMSEIIACCAGVARDRRPAG